MIRHFNFYISDFCDSIANLTLIEYPNSLYNDRRTWHEHYEDQDYATTDYEEVDSDSGYSSPLHRRNRPASSAPTTTTAVSIISSSPVTHSTNYVTSSKTLQPHPPNIIHLGPPPRPSQNALPHVGVPPVIRPAIHTFPVSQYSYMPMFPRQVPDRHYIPPELAANSGWHVTAHTDVPGVEQYGIPKPQVRVMPHGSKLNAEAEEFKFTGTCTTTSLGVTEKVFNLDQSDFPELRSKDGRIHTLSITRISSQVRSEFSDKFPK